MKQTIEDRLDRELLTFKQAEGTTAPEYKNAVADVDDLLEFRGPRMTAIPWLASSETTL
jgi:hypothetical protein